MASARIVHISTAHPAFDVRIFHKECASLAQARFDVHLIVRAERKEIASGVTIHPLPVRRSRLARALLGSLSAWRMARSLHGDIYHIHDPELLPVAYFLKRGGAKVVYDSHEHFRSHILIKNWIAPPLRPAIGWLAGAVEDFVAHRVDGIVATSGPIAAPFPPEKTVLVRNFPRRSQVCTPQSSANDGAIRRVAYVGMISEQRCARELIEAMALIPEELQIRLSLAGRIEPAALGEELRGMPGWSKVDYLGEIAFREINGVLAGAIAGIAICAPRVNYMNALSTKVFDYMAAGVPVISSGFPGWREVVAPYDCTIFVNGMAPREIADAIVKLADDPHTAHAMGMRGQNAVKDNINWENEFRALVELYGRLGAKPDAKAVRELR